MSTNAHTGTGGPLTVTRVGRSVWILRLVESLEQDTVSALRDAFGDAIERDATDIVVDLGAVVNVSTRGATTLAALADHMRSRNGALWIAAAWPDGEGHTLRPIHEPGPTGLMGISPVLDRALDGALGCGPESRIPDLHEAPPNASPTRGQLAESFPSEDTHQIMEGLVARP